MEGLQYQAKQFEFFFPIENGSHRRLMALSKHCFSKSEVVSVCIKIEVKCLKVGNYI